VAFSGIEVPELEAQIAVTSGLIAFTVMRLTDPGGAHRPYQWGIARRQRGDLTSLP
jgi:hypothetical protein